MRFFFDIRVDETRIKTFNLPIDVFVPKPIECFRLRQEKLKSASH